VELNLNDKSRVSGSENFEFGIVELLLVASQTTRHYGKSDALLLMSLRANR
jgi:hypothetical protein